MATTSFPVQDHPPIRGEVLGEGIARHKDGTRSHQAQILALGRDRIALQGTLHYKSTITTFEVINRSLKLITPMVFLLGHFSHLTTGRTQTVLLWIGRIKNPFGGVALFFKGLNYWMNDYRETDEPDVVQNWCKLVCPLSMMFMGASIVGGWAVKLTGLKIPAGVMKNWSTVNFCVGGFGAANAFVFMWSSYHSAGRELDRLDSITDYDLPAGYDLSDIKAALKATGKYEPTENTRTGRKEAAQKVTVNAHQVAVNLLQLRRKERILSLEKNRPLLLLDAAKYACDFLVPMLPGQMDFGWGMSVVPGACIKIGGALPGEVKSLFYQVPDMVKKESAALLGDSSPFSSEETDPRKLEIAADKQWFKDNGLTVDKFGRVAALVPAV